MNESVNPDLQQILEQFPLGGPPREIRPYGSGNINRTYMVTSQKGERYILQRISEALTSDPAGLMENIEKVLDHLHTKEKDPRRVMRLLRTKAGTSFCQDAGGAWRIYHYVEDTICLSFPEKPEDFYQSALAFGRFEQDLKDFPVEQLHETIVDFHNTPLRCRHFHEALSSDTAGRKSSVGQEIRSILEREQRMGILQRMRTAGELPCRVTHNDTKLSNVLFDARTREALCVIDLDTVMPGLSLYDFGDAIRYGASTAAEDEQDLSKVALDPEMYEAFREGFLTACSDLTAKEKELLPLGAWVITMEQAVRFLADYLQGDVYYHTAYPDQNLFRTRTQLKLASDMEKHWHIGECF